MIDAKTILGGLMQAGLAPSSTGRVERAVGPQGLGGQGGLLEQLAGMLGGTGGGGAAGGAMGGGLGAILGQLQGTAKDAVGRTTDAVKRNDPLAVGGLGALAGAILGGRGGAVGGGLMAVLGSLAYGALQNMQAQQAQAAATANDTSPLAVLPPEVRGAATPDEEASVNARAMVLVQAMIAAAKADGQIDAAERERILGKLAEGGADQDARDWVLMEMRAPLDLDAIVAQAGSPDLALEVYAASVMAIEVDTEAERAYLTELARRLSLPAPAVAYVNRALGIG
jgi:uncharacterized membrane protein YebE (DUF533 family)